MKPLTPSLFIIFFSDIFAYSRYEQNAGEGKVALRRNMATMVPKPTTLDKVASALSMKCVARQWIDKISYQGSFAMRTGKRDMACSAEYHAQL